MLIQVGAQSCVSPCALGGLPNGPIPWRSTAPGLITQGGVLVGSDDVQIASIVVPKRAALLKDLEPLWTLPKEEANVLLADQRKAFAAPQFLWVRVGTERLSVLRGQVVPRGALFYRGETRLSEDFGDSEILAMVQATLAESASVGEPITPIGAFARLGRWWSNQKLSMPTLPKLSLPKVSKRTLVLSGATIVGTAAVAGLVTYLSSAPKEVKTFDPALGF